MAHCHGSWLGIRGPFVQISTFQATLDPGWPQNTKNNITSQKKVSSSHQFARCFSQKNPTCKTFKIDKKLAYYYWCYKFFPNTFYPNGGFPNTLSHIHFPERKVKKVKILYPDLPSNQFIQSLS